MSEPEEMTTEVVELEMNLQVAIMVNGLQAAAAQIAAENGFIIKALTHDFKGKSSYQGNTLNFAVSMGLAGSD